MNVVPSSPDPDRRPEAAAVGAATPALSIGTIQDVDRGALLVAMPGLGQSDFAGTVLYVLDHSDSGTVGVVLNRPSTVRIRDVLPGWCDLATAPEVFHVGGPCESETALCLAIASAGDRAPDGLRPVAGDVHLVDLDSDPAHLLPLVSGLRVFAGYAGWSPGQLEAEITEGSWACVPSRPDDVIASVGGVQLWRRVLQRQTGALGVLRSAACDPTQN